MRQLGIGGGRPETGSVQKPRWKEQCMKNAALSIAVAIALFAAFVYGVEFGRKVEHDAAANARVEASAASSYSEGDYSPETYSFYSYTPDENPDTSYTPED